MVNRSLILFASSALQVQPPQILLVGNIVNGPSAADTNKLAPGLDLGGDPALHVFPQAALRYFFRETINKELSCPWVV